MSTNRVRRRIVACARCRSRKIVCDAASPSCSKCSQAGVACVAVSASNQASAPRSIVQFLENELANREKSENKLDLLESANQILVDQVMKDCTPLFLGLTSSIPLLRCAVAGTRLPSASLPGAVEFTEQHQTSLLDSEAGSTRLADIPVSIADFLFKNYVKRVVIQCPIFYLPDIVQYFDSVYHNPIHTLEPGSLSTPYETYVVSLIMAISLTTSARTQQLRANSIAMGLLKTAMQHTQAVYTNDLKGLQAILLLCEYAFLNPSVADVWLLSGFSTQICIDLGLHQETSNDLNKDPLTIDMRRRVFWCAYEMEIATSAALLRPTCFLTKHINTPFPSEVEDGAISATGIDASAPATKAFALWIWKYRHIEAEVISVLFHNVEITLPETLDLWTQRMENAIDTWRAEFLGFADLNNGDATSEEMKLYATIAHAYVKLSLFRPSPRVKEPSSESLIKAFMASVDVAKGYHAQSNLGFGNSKYVFHPCYHTFSAAIVFLQSLERCKASICLRYTVDEIEDFILSFSKSFTAIAERWPAASRCLEEFERLMVPVKCKYIDFALNEARAASNGFGSTASLIDPGGAEPLLYYDELMDFQSFFPHDVFNTQDIGGLPFTIPSDWEFEFDFGIT